MISVIITVHPPLLKHLPRCLNSVLWQMEAADECWLVGDGLDISGFRMAWEIVPGHRGRLHSLGAGEVRGVSHARNRALGQASGEWLKFLDADDLLAPFALNAFRALESKVPAEVACLMGGYFKVHNGMPVGFQTPPDIESLIAKVNPCLVSPSFIRRAAAAAVGGFDERIQFEEDWDFWLRLRRAGHRFATTKTPFAYYWIDDAERAEKQRDHTVEGMDVRDYLAKTYGITPQR